jgi:hypothetical protein
MDTNSDLLKKPTSAYVVLQGIDFHLLINFEKSKIRL